MFNQQEIGMALTEVELAYNDCAPGSRVREHLARIRAYLNNALVQPSRAEATQAPSHMQDVRDILIDAERYRWLRDKMPRPLDGQATFWLRRGADLDEAVDAARLDCSPQQQEGK